MFPAAVASTGCHSYCGPPSLHNAAVSVDNAAGLRANAGPRTGVLLITAAMWCWVLGEHHHIDDV